MTSYLLEDACHDIQSPPYLYEAGGVVSVMNTFVHFKAMEMEKGLRRCSSAPAMCREGQAASVFNNDHLNRKSDDDSMGKLSDNSTSLASVEGEEDSRSSLGSDPLLFSMASESECEEWECEECEVQELEEQSEATWDQEENGQPALMNDRRAKAKAATKLAHPEGRCKPCLYFAFKEDGCRAGDDCTYCHECSRDDILARRKMHKREARASRQVNRKGGRDSLRTSRRNGNAPSARTRARKHAAEKQSSSKQTPTPTPIVAEVKALEAIAVTLRAIGRSPPTSLPTVFSKVD